MKYLSILAFILIAAGPTHAQDIDRKAVDAIIQQALKEWHVPGVAVAIVQDDKIVYLEGHGVREIGKPEPITPDTLFAIASVTKSFTAAAVATMVDDGKMKWDDPVKKYLRFFRLSDPLASEQASLRDLLCHRTGLSGHNELWGDSPWSREELVRRAGFLKLSKPFRTTWQYQNLMYLAAGMAAGAANKSSWEQLVQRRLFDPLGMTGANFSARTTELAPNHASPHRNGKVIPFRNLDVAGPFVSINASARDMAQWVRFQLGDGTLDGKRVLSEAQLKEMHTPQIVMNRQHELLETLLPEHDFFSYGLGWFVNDYRGHVLVWHSGDIDGFSALVTLVPKSKLGIVILSNLDGSYMRYALQYNLLDLLLGLPKTDWNAWQKGVFDNVMAMMRAGAKALEDGRRKDTKPSRELSAYVGTFEEPAYGKVVISLDKGALQLQWNRFRGPLSHFEYDTFITSPEGPPYLQSQHIQFDLGRGGGVSTMKMYGVEFKKIK